MQRNPKSLHAIFIVSLESPGLARRKDRLLQPCDAAEDLCVKSLCFRKSYFIAMLKMKSKCISLVAH